MARLYGRRYALKIGDQGEYLDIEMRDNELNLGNALRIAFMVHHDFNNTQSLADITIFGLTRENEAKIFEQYNTVELQAGYPELFGQIFKGQLTNVQRLPIGNSGTRGVRLFCWSTARETQIAHLNKSFSGETPVKEIIMATAAGFGVPVEMIGDFDSIPRNRRSTTLRGSAKAILEQQGRTYGFSHSIENGVMILAKNGAVREGEIFDLSAATGMIGSPVVSEGSTINGVEKSFLEVRAALNPTLRLNSLVKINSLSPEFAFSGAYTYKVPRSVGEGIYEILTITHTGDSYGNVWESQLYCSSYNAAQRLAEARQSKEAGL